MEKQKKFLCPIRASKQLFGEKTAIIYNDIEISYKKLDLFIDQIGERLSNFSHYKIALHGINSFQLIVLIFACFRKEITPIIIPTRWPKFQIEKALKDLNCKLLLSDDNTIKCIETPTASFEQVFEKREDCNTPAHINKNVSIIFFTSSSTSFSKACSLSLRGLLTSAAAVSEKIQLTTKSHSLLTLPLFHIAGFSLTLRTLIRGATLTISKSITESLLLHPISHISLVPTQLQRLLQEPKKTLKKISSSLISILVGGAPIGKTLLELGLKYHLPIDLTYGMTELGSSVFIQNSPSFCSNEIYLGKPLKHIQAAVSEEGELMLKGCSLFKGYYEEDKLISATNERGWFCTKDLVKFCSKKGYCIIGRKDNQFISGGENIQPEQIERYLLGLDNVFQAVCVPISDKEFGQRPIVFISTSEKFEKIKDRLEKLLPKFSVPQHFFSLDEIKSTQMKWKKADLIKLASEKINIKL